MIYINIIILSCFSIICNNIWKELTYFCFYHKSNCYHHRIIAIIPPNIVPREKPKIVSIHVIFKCSSKSFDDKFKNVFKILDGWLVIKLSIFPVWARISHITINAITIDICVTKISILRIFSFFRYQDEIQGPLILQVNKAIDLIYLKYLKALIHYEGVQRIDEYIFPIERI